MITPINTVSSRDVQRNYRQIVAKVQDTNRPLIIISRNQPEMALVSLVLLEEYKQLKSRDADWSIVNEMRELNTSSSSDKEIAHEIREEVEKVRQERYEKRQQAKRGY